MKTTPPFSILSAFGLWGAPQDHGHYPRDNSPIGWRAAIMAFFVCGLALFSALVAKDGRIPSAAWEAISFLMLAGGLNLALGALSFIRRYRKPLANWVILGVALFIIQEGVSRDLMQMRPFLILYMKAFLFIGLIRMEFRRDVSFLVAPVVILLLVQLLGSQNIQSTLLAGLTTFSLVFLLSITSERRAKVTIRRHLGRTLALSVLSVPLMLSLFLVFPRLPINNLKSMMSEERSVSGMGLSNKMSPGSISELIVESNPAFDVRISDGSDIKYLSKDQMYWRATIMGKFDGRTWSEMEEGEGSEPTTLSIQNPTKDILRYSVSTHGQRTRYIPVLEGTIDRIAAAYENVGEPIYPDRFALYSLKRETRDKIYYSASAKLSYQYQHPMGDSEYALWTQLPQGFNPKTRAYAEELLAQSRKDLQEKRKEVDGGEQVAQTSSRHSSDLSRLVVQKVLKRFNAEPYRYTLKPPKLGRHSVDEFLFDTAAGFCEYYSSAFVFTMRAAGIPARVVTGYQGGEYNKYRKQIEVTSKDAHAWAEVWHQGLGWVRVDPTAVIDPSRVEDDAREAFGLESETWKGWMLQAKMMTGVLNGLWNDTILAFDASQQESLMNRLGVDSRYHGFVMAGFLAAVAGTLALAALGAQTLRRRIGLHPSRQILLLLDKKLERIGIDRPLGQTLSSVAKHLGQSPDERQAADLLLRYVAIRYHSHNPAKEQELYMQLLRDVRAWRPNKVAR